MNINCKTCKQDVEAYLHNLPSKWREKLAEIICKYVICDNPPALDCETFNECETLTTLSDFVVTDTEACITYVDEHGVSVERCFDFSNIINGTMDDVDPKCITDQTTWNNWTFIEKWQSIVDKVCDNCDGLGEDCICVTLTNDEIELGVVVYYYTYTNCSDVLVQSNLPFGESVSMCIRAGTLSTNFTDTIVNNGLCGGECPPGATTTTTLGG